MSMLGEYAHYMPHGMCLLWQPWLLALWAGSDALIFLSYMAIPIALLSVLRARGDVPHHGLVVLFASFILLCGITHALGIVTLWIPIYPFVGVVKLATGVVSLVTAIMLFRLVPALVALPSPAAMTEANERLKAEIAAHEATLAQLELARAGLEAQVEQRTAELREANGELAVLAREAVHRSRNLLSVVGSLAQQSARGHDRTAEFLETFLGRVRALANATATIMRADNQASEQLDAIVRGQLEPLLLAYGEKVTIAGPEVLVGSEAAQQISLALHELSTNAQKYSLPHGTDTGVAIDWTILPGADGGEELQLTWREVLSEGHEARSSSAGSAGFGTKLLTRIIPVMLKGSATHDLGALEFVYRLTAPLSTIHGQAHRSGDAAKAARIVDEQFGLDAN